MKQVFEHGTSLVYGMFCFVCIAYIYDCVPKWFLLELVCFCFFFVFFLLVGNLLFRLLHNFFFGCVLPRHRVCISLLATFSSMSLLCLVYFWFESTQVFYVYICYLLGGIGVGTFEANLLATITPLGPDTKVWAIVGMCAGFTIISVFGYALMGTFDISVVYLYLFVSVMCLISIFLWYYRIPTNNDSHNIENQQSLKDFIQYLKDWRQWLLKVKWNCVALCLDMFCVAFFSAINQYILSGDKIPLFGMLHNILHCARILNFILIFCFSCHEISRKFYGKIL